MIKINKLISSDCNRTALAKLNVIVMLGVKGLSILLQFALLPLTVSYVSSSVYGIWLSLSSIIAWMSFFDVGINNGLKNRYIQAIAENNIPKAKGLVSTTYAFLLCIFVPVTLILLICNQFLNWSSILNIQSDGSITQSVSIIVVYFSANFIFSTVNVIMSAEQKPAYASVIHLLQQVFTFIVIMILVKTTEGSLLKLCLALCLCPLAVLLFYNIYIFKGKYRTIAPDIKSIDFSFAKDLFSLGFKFFVIQVAVIVLYQTSNFIMIRYYGPESVTQYNVAYKLFFSLNMVFAIIITPVWAAVTDAIAKNEIEWVQRAFRKYIYILFSFIILALILLFFSDDIYYIWMGNTIDKIPFALSACLCAYVCITLCGSLMAYFLNGAGILKLQFLNCLLAPFIFIAVVMFFIKELRMGVYSVPLSIIIASFYSYIISPIQCYLVFFKGVKGIWSK